MNAQAEYEDVCARHEYEFGIHLHHIYIYSSIRLEITAKTDNIRIVVQNMKYIYLHSTRLCTVKHRATSSGTKVRTIVTKVKVTT